MLFFFFKQKTAYEMRISDWSSDVCSSDLLVVLVRSTLFGVGSIVIQALLPLVARDLVGGGSFTYGVLLGAFGIGAVGGAVGSGVLHQRLSTEGVVRVASIAFAVATVNVGVSPFLQSGRASRRERVCQ